MINQPDNMVLHSSDLDQTHRREYSSLVTNEIIEDHSLRYSPAKFRKWSEFTVSNTAIGSISFLALEAIGASIAITNGFQNAFWGILVASVLIFILGAPICYQVAKNNIDIDLLTRAAGFGYLGSTVTSLIYASFCFIFFALEAAIMAQALYLYTGLPLPAGYVLCSLIIIPVVYYGMTAISRLQVITQPVWLVLMIVPFVMVLMKDPNIVDRFINFPSYTTGDSQFSWELFGISLGISLSLIAQIGEQADYLRFMPDKTKDNRLKWWLAVILAGPGWTILGFLKQIGGIFLAALVLLGGASLIEAREPIHMYNAAYKYVFENPEVALLVSFIFVMVSQIKINVTNAYAGSLAWSNFFSRSTHTHLGRAVWVIFNIAIALLLMLMGVFEVLEKILGLYSNVAIAWIAAIFADLMINKPLGLCPPVIEFKRAYLFNINPVGCISTLVASILAIIAFSGVLGSELQAFSSMIALSAALILSPLLCYLTKGNYYIAREADVFESGQHRCGVCQAEYSAPDMAICPMHSTSICSLCCSVEGRCHDLCKTAEEFDIKEKIIYWAGEVSRGRVQPEKLSRITGFLVIFIGLLSTASFLLWTSYIVQIVGVDPTIVDTISNTYVNIFYLLALILFIGSWLIVLMQESRDYVETERQQAEESLKEQTERVTLLRETATNANKSRNLDEALHTCLATVCKHAGWPVGHAYLLPDENAGVLVSSDIWHLDDPKLFRPFVEATEGMTFKPGVGLPGRVLESGEPAWIDDVTNDPNFPRAKLAHDIGVRGAFAFPVLSSNKVVAVLEFFDELEGTLDESLLATVAHIGGQLGRVFDREQVEKELHDARDAAEEATKAKAAFLATMSHEIRTPMTGVIGMVDLLTQSKLDDDQYQMMHTVRDSAYALLTIINDILDFSKIEAGKLELEAIPFSIRDAIEGMAETLGPNANKKGIRISIHVDPDIPDAVLGDQVRIRQVLFNIGGNAVKFTEEGRVLISARRLPETDEKKVTVRMEISDSGIGMSEEGQKNLFKEFSQAESSTTRRFGGTGLGLSICQRLTEMMGGKIEVESELGKGSTFIVTLTFPIAEEHAIKSDGHDLTGLRVLFAGDDAEDRELDAKYLRHWGAEVITFGEIEQTKAMALEAVAEKKSFDVIVLGSAWPLETRAAHIAAMQKESDLTGTRFVLMTQTRTKADRKEITNTVYVDCHPIRRAPFIRAIAVAAGLASPDISHDEDEIIAEAVKAPTIEEAEAAGNLILVAEDNPTNQNVIRRQLNMLGYAAEMADDGKQALAAYKSKSYAILLTDCHMPVMDGFELTQAIRETEMDGDERLPIIAITASVLAAEIDRCYEAGMDDSLPKPLEMPKLKTALRKWMPDYVPATAEENGNQASEAADTTEEVESGDGESPIDPSALKSVFGDDDETFKEIMKDFVEPATSNVGEIEASFADRSADGVAKAAHKLKSSARSVGANDLADLCQTLEEAGKTEDWDEIDKAAPRLSSTIRKVVEYIENL